MSEDLPGILCHPDGEKSCGACCGMYNHVDHGDDELRRRLRERTRAFFDECDIDDEESLRDFRHRWEDGADVKLLKALPSCPFLGFVDFDDADDGDGDFGRVGCLVHPLQNDGVDGRDCGIYDRFICDEYLCAAHDILGDEELQLILDAVDDSYLYGLMITNPKFVRQLLQLVADRAGVWPTRRLLEQSEIVEEAQLCFEMMRDWPYRADDGIFGQMRVDGELNTKRRPLPAERHDVTSVDVDVLLACLGTACESVDELEEARRIVEERVDALAEVVERLHP